MVCYVCYSFYVMYMKWMYTYIFFSFFSFFVLLVFLFLLISCFCFYTSFFWLCTCRKNSCDNATANGRSESNNQTKGVQVSSCRCLCCTFLGFLIDVEIEWEEVSREGFLIVETLQQEHQLLLTQGLQPVGAEAPAVSAAIWNHQTTAQENLQVRLSQWRRGDAIPPFSLPFIRCTHMWPVWRWRAGWRSGQRSEVAAPPPLISAGSDKGRGCPPPKHLDRTGSRGKKIRHRENIYFSRSTGSRLPVNQEQLGAKTTHLPLRSPRWWWAAGAARPRY